MKWALQRLSFQVKEEEKIKEWLSNWKLTIKELNLDLEEMVKKMDSINPIYIPRNHNVDKAIKAAYKDNLEPMNELLEALKNPFEENKKYSHREGGLLKRFFLFI